MSKIKVDWSKLAKLRDKTTIVLMIILLSVTSVAVYLGAEVSMNVNLQVHVLEVQLQEALDQLELINQTLKVVINSTWYALQKPMSYIISNVNASGTVYTCMQNGTTAKLVQYSTDDDDIINWANGNLTSGGKVFVRDGAYSIDPITISNPNIVFECESWNTVFTLSSGTDQWGIKVTANNVVLRNFKIDGNKTGQSGTNVVTGCIALDDVTNSLVDHVYAVNGRRYGIIIYEGSYNTVKNSKVVNATDNGITAQSSATKGTHHNTIVNNEVLMNSDVGIALTGNDSPYEHYGSTIQGNLIHHINGSDAVTGYNNNWGIALETLVMESEIKDNVIYGNALGITTRGASYGNQIEGNMVYNNTNGMELWSDGDTVNDNTVILNDQSGINAFCTYSDINDNILVNNTAGSGLRLRAEADFNRVTGNMVQNNTQGIYLFSGSASNSIEHNYIGNNEYEEIKDDSAEANIFKDNGGYNPKGYIANAFGLWISPNGYDDPDSAWTSEASLYDGSTSTSATGSALATWGSFINLTRSAETVDKIRYYVHTTTDDTVNAIDVDIYTTSWINVYNGSFTEGIWEEKTFTQGSVSQARIRFNGTGTVKFAEFDFYASWCVDSGVETVQNNTLYYSWQSPKVIYIDGGTVSSVQVEGQEVFTTTNVMVVLQPSDTFKIVWSVEPTIKVIGQ